MRSGVELDVRPPLELERMAGGALVAIRDADEPGDDALLRELALDFARSQRGVRRFGFTFGRRVPRALRPFTHPEQLEECLLALDARDGTPIGMASIVGTPGEHSARPWLMVRAGSRRRGVGTALLERLVARAREDGHDRFRMELVVGEPRMLELMRHVGIPCTPEHGQHEVDAEVPLPSEEGLGVALGAALWAIARGGLMPTLPRW